MKKRYGLISLIELATMLLVPVIFILFKERRVAAAIAGLFFITIPVLGMYMEFKYNNFKNKIFYVLHLQFWVLFALPIFMMRVYYWNNNFYELSIAGIPLFKMHVWSQYSYSLMFLSSVYAYFKSRKLAVSSW